MKEVKNKMTCFRTQDGKTLHSKLSPRQYSRFFYEINYKGQDFEWAYRRALTSKPRSIKSISSLFSPETISLIKDNMQENSVKDTLNKLNNEGKLIILKGKQ